MKDRLEIVASGFGGQGVVRLGQVLGEAAVKEGLRVTMLKSHGTEMRGGYVRAQVVLSPNTIDSPMCENPDFFVALSSAAYNRFKDTVPESGVILFDPAFVEEIDEKLACTHRELPAKQLAMDNFGRPIFSNSIALGAMAKLLENEMDKEVILESLLEIIPKFHDKNREAFQVGYDYMS
ncbi:MAG: 2-oxoacid:acceptor oxidoreductase family protein [Desulfarculus sp.]|nr:2-oxoacid:acceptor oxidoreductase family protein [Pseudomonadota bacterium]MBV1715847.1 2-oxoacid:acceptor oxidoreductase family protein [Desulfarculus sp.]MBU4574717.1 2-oxoacid:acceptor oxidoreductase family protein [Pseudomonadota bacterium]MBU4600201.1 2-oxoacid:acceptor oxidoreductase family protein [Pseudomonadota bacterium]MBV1738572.1 2-oxoacid:acceptor oxidoreductase family protein [Desulfarculus sp.]